MVVRFGGTTATPYTPAKIGWLSIGSSARLAITAIEPDTCFGVTNESTSQLVLLEIRSQHADSPVIGISVGAKMGTTCS
jgi:hypothetical protein